MPGGENFEVKPQSAMKEQISQGFLSLVVQYDYSYLWGSFGRYGGPGTQRINPVRSKCYFW